MNRVDVDNFLGPKKKGSTGDGCKSENQNIIINRWAISLCAASGSGGTTRPFSSTAAESMKWIRRVSRLPTRTGSSLSVLSHSPISGHAAHRQPRLLQAPPRPLPPNTSRRRRSRRRRKKRFSDSFPFSSSILINYRLLYGEMATFFSAMSQIVHPNATLPTFHSKPITDSTRFSIYSIEFPLPPHTVIPKMASLMKM